METKRTKRGINIQNKDDTSIEVNYSTGISCAYHVHMAGDHEKSFTYNSGLAIYASNIGDLDIAERCYKRAIADAEYLGRIKDKMDCLYDMIRNVYSVWARYEEALSNYQSLLKYYDSINDSRMQVSVSNSIALIHHIKGEYEQAMNLWNDNLKRAKEIGDQDSISFTLNNIAVILDDKAEYDQALKLYNRKLGDKETARRSGRNSWCPE